MIKQILQIAQSCTAVQILAKATADGCLSLTFVPQVKEGADLRLARVFTLMGTPEELEANIASHLEEIQAKRETLAETVEAVKAVLEQDAKDAATAAAAKKAGKTKPAVGSQVANAKAAGHGTASGDDPDEEDGDGDGDDTTPPPTAGASAPASTSAAPSAELNLFE
jgi:PRTRC genetic system protein E